MALIIEYMRNVNEFLNKYEDHRLANWPLMSTPFYTLGICLTYVYIVTILGPNLMKHRKPFQLRRTLIIYNLFQVVFNTWMWQKAARAAWFNGYSFKCQPMDYSDHPNTIALTHAVYWYYISKFVDLLDTIFFVLRKKNDQISTLHVTHHALLPISIWFGAKLAPTGHSTLGGFLNAFVHILMYSYYLLSAFGPKVQKYLWWKKYLTTIQMSNRISEQRKNKCIIPNFPDTEAGTQNWPHFLLQKEMEIVLTIVGGFQPFAERKNYTHLVSCGLGTPGDAPDRRANVQTIKINDDITIFIQFIIVMVHSLQLYFIECDYPRLLADAAFLHALLFLFLFKQFYNKSYAKKNSLTNNPKKNREVTSASTKEESSEEGFKVKNSFDVKYKGKYIN